MLSDKISIRTLLRPEAIELLNDRSNYSTDNDTSKNLYCTFCKRKFEKKKHALILWDESQEHYISFHLDCAMEKENTQIFFERLERGMNIFYK